MPNTIVITPDRNHNAKDYTGAFEPESAKFMEVIPGKHRLIKIDVSKPFVARKRQLFSELERLSGGRYSAVAVFCHGWHNGIQAGVRLGDLSEFVRLIGRATTTGTSANDVLYIPLYCCSTATAEDSVEGRSETGEGDGSFADLLRDTFCRQGKPWVRVFAHTSAGHTTMNPQVRVFEGKGSEVGFTGGEAFVRQPPPKNPLWPLWRDALAGKGAFKEGTMKEPKAFHAGTRGSPGSMERKHLRFAAPFMTIAELHAALAPDGVV